MFASGVHCDKRRAVHLDRLGLLGSSCRSRLDSCTNGGHRALRITRLLVGEPSNVRDRIFYRIPRYGLRHTTGKKRCSGVVIRPFRDSPICDPLATRTLPAGSGERIRCPHPRLGCQISTYRRYRKGAFFNG